MHYVADCMVMESKLAKLCASVLCSVVLYCGHDWYGCVHLNTLDGIFVCMCVRLEFLQDS